MSVLKIPGVLRLAESDCPTGSVQGLLLGVLLKQSLPPNCICLVTWSSVTVGFSAPSFGVSEEFFLFLLLLGSLFESRHLVRAQHWASLC